MTRFMIIVKHIISGELTTFEFVSLKDRNLFIKDLKDKFGDEFTYATTEIKVENFNKYLKIIASLLLVTALSACSGIPLKAGAESVVIQDYGEASASCKYVEELKGPKLNTYASNHNKIVNDFKNQAFERGENLVIVRKQNTKVQRVSELTAALLDQSINVDSQYIGKAYKCEN